MTIHQNDSKINPYAERVKVTAVHPTHKAGTIKAFASVKFGEVIEIHGCKVIQQESQRAWVAMPDRPRTDEKGYAPIVQIHNEQLKEAITAAVLAAWREGGAQ